MAAEAVVYVRTLYPQNRRSGSHSHRRLCSCIRACQPSNDKSKFYKELGFSLTLIHSSVRIVSNYLSLNLSLFNHLWFE